MTAEEYLIADFLNIAIRQAEFQSYYGIDMSSLSTEDKLRLTEIYSYKAGDELGELRRTVPSFLNKYAKHQPEPDRAELLKEFVDVILFMVNIAMVWNIDLGEFIKAVHDVQDNNFIKLRRRIANENGSQDISL